jgi:hypothetical protein
MILEFLRDWGAYSASVRGHNPDMSLLMVVFLLVDPKPTLQTRS